MNNIQFFIKFLEDNKFSKGRNLHPEFIKVLRKYDNENIMDTLMYSVQEYAPTLSYTELAAVCTELSENILLIGGSMAREMQRALDENGIGRQTEDEFNRMVEEIRKEQSLA